MHLTRSLYFLPVLVLFSSLALPAQAQPEPPELSEQSQISVLTILPGDEIYSLWGHSAFRVFDPDQGIDLTYNYGTFDFSNVVVFTARFAYGRMDYMLSVEPFPRTVLVYRDYLKRPIIEQVLRLDREQRTALFRFLQTNALPENRTYRYDFLYDNCSTRIRDVLEAALGARIRFASEPDPGLSFRQLINLYGRQKPFLDLGMNLLLGTPTDRTAAPYQTMFLPDFLMEALAHASVETEESFEPLVASTDTVFWIDGYKREEAPPPWPAFLFWLTFALATFLTLRAYRKDDLDRRWPDVVLFGAAGLGGLLLVVMWFATEHTVPQNNWNLFWMWPTHTVAAIALARRNRPGWLRAYMMAIAFVTLVFCFGWFFWPQGLHPAALPLALLLALRGAWWAYALRRRAAA